MHFRDWLLADTHPTLHPLRSFAESSDWATGVADKAAALADLEARAPANLDQLRALLDRAWSAYQAGQAQQVPVLAPAGGPPAAPPPRKGKFASTIDWLGANFGLITIGILSAALLVAIFYSIIFDQNFIRLLAHTEVARGLITFFFAVGTIGVAIVIAFSVLTGDIQHIKERFGLAKDVLTILIGVLGTIIGYYFGTTQDGVDDTALQIAQPLVVPAEVAPGAAFQILSSVQGGEPPYSYSVRFDDESVVGIEHATAENGLLLNLPFNVPAGFASAALPFELVIRDSAGREKSFSRMLGIAKQREEVAAADQ